MQVLAIGYPNCGVPLGAHPSCPLLCLDCNSLLRVQANCSSFIISLQCSLDTEAALVIKLLLTEQQMAFKHKKWGHIFSNARCCRK